MIPDPAFTPLLSSYLTNQRLIFEHTPSKSSSTREYTDLSWRMDVEVARRAVHNVATPTWTFEVKTTAMPIKFQADAAMLAKLQSELELALREEKEQHSQRFQRYMN